MPLEAWTAGRADLRELPIGPSRHLVRFVQDDDRLIALKEEPIEIARREYDVLRRLESLQLPAVLPLGPGRDARPGQRDPGHRVPRHSLQYRRLLMRLPAGPSSGRDRLLDAMASLLVDLHRGGVYWGDCSLANTLFRRDGDLIQAYLVDAETSETHAELSDGQREYDLEVLVENVAFGLADLAASQRTREPDRRRATTRRSARPRASRSAIGQLWAELHAEEELAPGDRYAVAARVRRLNDLGFAIDEIELEPSGSGGRLRFRIAVATRRFHARELERRTGLVALEGQARILMNDLREYRSWLQWFEHRRIERPEAARRWLDEVYRPTIARLAVGRGSGSGHHPGLLRRARAQVAAVRAGRPRRRPGDRDPVLPRDRGPGTGDRRATRRLRPASRDSVDLPDSVRRMQR